MHFAGEATSTYSQGFLNGGVESGDRAAIEIMRKLRVRVPHRSRTCLTPSSGAKPPSPSVPVGLQHHREADQPRHDARHDQPEDLTIAP